MPEPEDRGDYLQDLLSQGTAAVRYAGGILRTGGSKSRGEDSTYPQSSTPELHETARYPDWVAHQLSSDETDRRCTSPDSTRREPMTLKIQQETTEMKSKNSVSSVSSCSRITSAHSARRRRNSSNGDLKSEAK